MNVMDFYLRLFALFYWFGRKLLIFFIFNEYAGESGRKWDTRVKVDPLGNYAKIFEKI